MRGVKLVASALDDIKDVITSVKHMEQRMRVLLADTLEIKRKFAMQRQAYAAVPEEGTQSGGDCIDVDGDDGPVTTTGTTEGNGPDKGELALMPAAPSVNMAAAPSVNMAAAPSVNMAADSGKCKRRVNDCQDAGAGGSRKRKRYMGPEKQMDAMEDEIKSMLGEVTQPIMLNTVNLCSAKPERERKTPNDESSDLLPDGDDFDSLFKKVMAIKRTKK